VDTAPGTAPTPSAADGEAPMPSTLPGVTSGPDVTNLPPELEQPQPKTDEPAGGVTTEQPGDTTPGEAKS
jgi:hypothetical protein